MPIDADPDRLQRHSGLGGERHRLRLRAYSVVCDCRAERIVLHVQDQGLESLIRRKTRCWNASPEAAPPREPAEVDWVCRWCSN